VHSGCLISVSYFTLPLGGSDAVASGEGMGASQREPLRGSRRPHPPPTRKRVCPAATSPVGR